mmetsp:Transcript_3768/g.11732  ORF Transcript_3768/g.11732 Transcript_3768/m.11732 type:complete len:372 (+) Transcript_3768:143-1258(+)
MPSVTEVVYTPRSALKSLWPRRRGPASCQPSPLASASRCSVTCLFASTSSRGRAPPKRLTAAGAVPLLALERVLPRGSSLSRGRCSPAVAAAHSRPSEVDGIHSRCSSALAGSAHSPRPLHGAAAAGLTGDTGALRGRSLEAERAASTGAMVCVVPSAPPSAVAVATTCDGGSTSELLKFAGSTRSAGHGTVGVSAGISLAATLTATAALPLVGNASTSLAFRGLPLSTNCSPFTSLSTSAAISSAEGSTDVDVDDAGDARFTFAAPSAGSGESISSSCCLAGSDTPACATEYASPGGGARPGGGANVTDAAAGAATASLSSPLMTRCSASIVSEGSKSAAVVVALAPAFRSTPPSLRCAAAIGALAGGLP